jgi:hypothetical protein
VPSSRSASTKSRGLRKSCGGIVNCPIRGPFSPKNEKLRKYCRPGAYFPKFVRHLEPHTVHELRKVMGYSQIYDSSAAFLFEVPGSNSPLAVQELQIGGTSVAPRRGLAQFNGLLTTESNRKISHTESLLRSGRRLRTLREQL